MLETIQGPRKAETQTMFAVGDGTLPEIVMRLAQVQVEEAELDFDSPDMIAKEATTIRAEPEPVHDPRDPNSDPDDPTTWTGMREVEIEIPAVLKADTKMMGVKFLQINTESLAALFPDAVDDAGRIRAGHMQALLLMGLQEAVAEFQALQQRVDSALGSGA